MPVVHVEVPCGILTTTVAFLFVGDGSAARKADWETPVAVHVAVEHEPGWANWANARDAPNVAASGIKSKRANVFVILITGELPFKTIIQPQATILR